MGSRHRCTRNVVRGSGRAHPRRDDVLAGGEDVDDSSIVGKASAGVRDRRGANGDCGCDPGGR
jgi:hypothetical protein